MRDSIKADTWPLPQVPGRMEERITDSRVGASAFTPFPIRSYESRDLPEVLAIWRRASDLAHPFLTTEFQGREAKMIEDVYLPEAETWVAVAHGDLVGFIALLGNEVGALFVDPDFHGRGYGRALVDHARLLRSHLFLDVFEDNSIGRRFYERYGFRVVNRGLHEPTGFPVLRMELP